MWIIQYPLLKRERKKERILSRSKFVLGGQNRSLKKISRLLAHTCRVIFFEPARNQKAFLIDLQTKLVPNKTFMLVYCHKIGFSRSRIRIFSEWEIRGGICLWLFRWKKKNLNLFLSLRLVCHFVNRAEGYPEVIWNKSVFWSQSSMSFKTPGLLCIVLANFSQYLDFGRNRFS